MYAKEMTTGDIETHLKELYDRDISDSTISCITDKIMPLLTRNLFYSLFHNIRKKVFYIIKVLCEDVIAV